MQLPLPPSPTLPNHDPPPSSVEERRSRTPSGDPPPPDASSSWQAGGRLGGRGPKEGGINAEAPPYATSAHVSQGEATSENGPRRPFERVNRRQRPQHAPPPQMAPSGFPLPPPGMRLVNVSYQYRRCAGEYHVQHQQQQQPPPQPPRSSSPPLSGANIPPAPPQHPHSRTTTPPPGRPPSPSSTSSASSGTTPVPDFERDISDFAQGISDLARGVSDFARDFYAAGAGDWSEEHRGGPGWSFSSSSSASRSTNKAHSINVNIIRDQDHFFVSSFWGVACAFFGKHDNLTILYISGGH